jgi:hypothetical protein
MAICNNVTSVIHDGSGMITVAMVSGIIADEENNKPDCWALASLIAFFSLYFFALSLTDWFGRKYMLARVSI